ncbi:MAG: hypothetical protein ACLSVD_01485 [Eggerthellaceae bacterium]
MVTAITIWRKNARHVHGHLQLLVSRGNLPRALFREPPQRQAHDMVAQGVLQRMADLLDADTVAAIVREKPITECNSASAAASATRYPAAT